MLRRLKKIFPAVVSAVLCAAMALGVTAYAADKTTELWKEAKALTSLKYNSNYINWGEKYSEKETKNTVAYSKSRTKKFLDKLIKTANTENPTYSFGLIEKTGFVNYVFKDGSLKIISLVDGEVNTMYATENAITLLSVKNKTKVGVSGKSYKEEIDKLSSEYTEERTAEVADIFDFDIAENAKGKIFKFKSDDKIYYYEEFDMDKYYGNVGFVFTEKGTPVTMVLNNTAFCISFKTTVDDSEFDIPKGYKTVDIDDFEY